MLFNSYDFVFFFGAVFIAYAVLQHKLQNVLLLVASYIFYGAWDWRFLGLIALSTVVDYICALNIDAPEASDKKRKTAVMISVCMNLGLLAFFKYFNFFIDSLESLLGGVTDVSAFRLDIILPVGISFYTFQTMSYTLDVYRKKMPATRDFLDFAVYVSFFPQLVAGPIERAAHFLPQVQRKRTITYEMLRRGAWLILYGYFKKVVIADNMAPIADNAFNNLETASSIDVLTGVYAFAFQIYGDFSGYSLIARGTSLLMGFDLMQNFRMPYFSLNPSEFWRRWHISLSSWLRDYLYIQLGGNRQGPVRTYVNLSLTMLLGGLWHGAAWHFVAWGAYQGLLLVVHRLAQPILGVFAPSGFAKTVWKLVRIVVFFQFVCVGWIFFRVNHLADTPLIITKLAQLGQAAMSSQQMITWAAMAALLIPAAIVEIAQEKAGDMWIIERWPAGVRFALYMLLFNYIAWFGVTSGSEFIYFQF